MAISVTLALEYEAVLTRAQMREASWASLAELDRILDALLAKALLVTPIHTRLRPALPDPSDDMVLECAVQAGARAIVTMNRRDFEFARRLYGLDILRPGEALAKVREGDTR